MFYFFFFFSNAPHIQLLFLKEKTLCIFLNTEGEPFYNLEVCRVNLPTTQHDLSKFDQVQLNSYSFDIFTKR